jgi:ABC-type Fe3+ transport system permease subunit
VAFVERIRYGEFIPTLWTLDGVANALSKADIVTMIFNSLLYSTLAMIFTVAIGIIVGYLLIRKKHLKGISVIMVVIGAYVGLILGAQLSSNVPNESKLIYMLIAAVLFAITFFFVGRMLNLRILEIFSTMPFAVPGIVLAVGYLTFFSSTTSLWGFLPAEFDLLLIYT